MTTDISGPKIRSVIAAVIRDEGRYLITKRSLSENPLPGYWSPLCGTVEPGEEQRDTVVREIREELGVTGRPVRLLETTPIEGEAVLYWWLAEIVEGHPAVCTTELSEIRWVTIGEMEDLSPIRTHNVETFRRIEGLHSRR